MGPNPAADVLLRRNLDLESQISQGRRTCSDRGRERRGAEATGTEAWNRLSLRASEKEPRLSTSGFRTSGLQDWERTNICCFKHPPPECGALPGLPEETGARGTSGKP